MEKIGVTSLAAAMLLVLSACAEMPAPALPESAAPTGLDLGNKGCGVNYSHNYQQGGVNGYGTPTSARTLDELRALGIRSLTLMTFGWMSSLTDARLQWRTDSAAGESFARVRKAAAAAHERGMTVLLKPHVWISKGAWQADLKPDPTQGGWAAWFADYERFLLQHATLAAEVKAEGLVIGTELRSSTRAHPEKWRAMIKKVRAVYAGTLLYGSEYDGVEGVAFWDALDGIGVHFYAPLTKSDDPSQAELDAEAGRWLRRFEALSARLNRPLVLSEAGFVNYAGTLKAPYTWASQAGVSVATAAGDRHQAMGYRALLSTFGRSPAVTRIYWWKWFSDSASGEEGPVGYWPRNKPAGKELAAACRVR
jgi:hypothetical protein